MNPINDPILIGWLIVIGFLLIGYPRLYSGGKIPLGDGLQYSKSKSFLESELAYMTFLSAATIWPFMWLTALTMKALNLGNPLVRNIPVIGLIETALPFGQYGRIDLWTIVFGLIWGISWGLVWFRTLGSYPSKDSLSGSIRLTIHDVAISMGGIVGLTITVPLANRNVVQFVTDRYLVFVRSVLKQFQATLTLEQAGSTIIGIFQNNFGLALKGGVIALILIFLFIGMGRYIMLGNLTVVIGLLGGLFIRGAILTADGFVGVIVGVVMSYVALFGAMHTFIEVFGVAITMLSPVWLGLFGIKMYLNEIDKAVNRLVISGLLLISGAVVVMAASALEVILSGRVRNLAVGYFGVPGGVPARGFNIVDPVSLIVVAVGIGVLIVIGDIMYRIGGVFKT